MDNAIIPFITASLFGSLVLGLVYWVLYGAYRERHLLLWAMSWLLYSLRFLFQVLLLQSPGEYSILLRILSLQSGLWSGLLLFVGSYKFIGRRTPPMWCVAAGGVSLGIGWAVLTGQSFLLQTMPTFLFLGMSEIWLGILFLRDRDLSLGIRLWPGLTLCLWGAHKLDYPLVRPLEWFAPWGYLIGAILAFTLAVGVLLAYFERLHSGLVQSERRFRDSFDLSAVGLAHVALDGRFLRVNQTFCRMLGLSDAEMLTRSFQDITHPDDLERDLELVRALLEGEVERYFLEKRYVRDDGQILWVDISVTLAHCADGSPDYFIAAVQDIQNRKSMEQRLRKSEMRHRLLVDNATEGIAVLREGRAVFANQRLCRLLDRPMSEVLALPFADFLQAADRAVFADWLDDTVELPPLVLHLSGLQAETRIVEMSSVPYDWEGHPATLHFLTDITERVRNEETVRGLAMFPSQNPNPVLRMTPDGELLYANDAASGAIQDSGVNPDALPPSVLRALREVAVSGNMQTVYVNLGKRTFMLSLAPVMDAGYVNIYGMDVTTLKETEYALRDACNRAESASRAKTEFLANLSHEIRTPLNGVLGMLQLLSAMELSGEQREYVETSLTSSRNLLTLLNDLLNLASLESGRMSFAEEAFDPAEQMRFVARTYEPQAREKGVSLLLELAPDLPEFVRGDSGRLRQILFNLVGNAMKFTDRGRVAMSLSPLCCANGVWTLLLVVEDTGIGMRQERVREAFEPFTQLDGSNSRRFGGSGLGLGIVRKLVQVAGGNICVDSEPGLGTVMYVTLRFEEANADARSVDSGEDAVMGRPLRLLLVEDERISRLSAQRFLEREGHTVLCAGNGVEALEVLKNETVDCVFMDVQMPILDGVSAVRRLRAGEAGERNRKVTVIALTAHAMQGDRDDFLEAGMDGYLAKPLDFAALREEMRERFG